MKKTLVFLFITSFIHFSCQSEDKIPSRENPGIEFRTSVTGRPFDASAGGYSRMYDANWEPGDQIGIYMTGAGDRSAIIHSNRIYSTVDGDGTFRAANGEEMMFPDDGSQVDFIAYYPYDAIGDDLTYLVRLTDQSSQSDIDLLYCATSTGYDGQSGPVRLSFDHRLTKLVFNIEVAEDLSANITKVIIGNSPSNGSFSLLTGELTVSPSLTDITMKSTVSGRTAVAEAILIPEENISGREVFFSLSDGTSVKWIFPAGSSLNQGDKYSYKVKITDGGGEVVPNYGWFETPSVTNIENTVFISHGLPEAEYSHIRNYSMLYDTKYFIAYWVAYPMCPFYREPTADKHTNWLYDPTIANSLQPAVNSGSWPGGVYQRGHQLPSADRRYSKAANRTTYFVTNQTPQLAALNGGIWSDLEEKVRDWMYECDTVYVVTGAMITSADEPVIGYTKDNNNKDVAVPKYYYKALAKYTVSTGEYHTIAFRMENKNLSGNIMNYHMSVTALERETGFTFFPYLDNDVKSTVTTTIWQ